MNQDNNAIGLVENLIETCRDGEKGYKDAASHVKRTDLKTFFTEQGAQRARFADELQLELSKLGKAEKKSPDRSEARCIGPGLIQRLLSVEATRQFWNQSSAVKTAPRRIIRKH